MWNIFQKVSLRGNREFSLEGIHTIWVNASSQDIRFFHGSGDMLVVKEYAEDETALAQAEKKGDALCLSVQKAGISVSLSLGSIGESPRIELYIPSSFAGQIYGASASGDILMDGVWKFKNLQFKTNSGDIELGNIKAEHFLVETESGDVRAEAAWGDRQFFAASGDLKIDGGRGSSRMKTVSGDISAAGLTGETCIKTTSGDIKASFEAVTGNIDAASTSGDIHIKTATGTSCRIAAKSTSGDITVHMRESQVQRQSDHSLTALVGVSASEEAVPLLKLSTVSGDIHVSD